MSVCIYSYIYNNLYVYIYYFNICIYMYVNLYTLTQPCLIQG